MRISIETRKGDDSMLVDELLDLARGVMKNKAEGQTIEVKAAEKGCPKRLYDTLSSFSNQDMGGTILFGIDEEAGFALVGVYDLQDLQKRVSDQCSQMSPPVRAVFTTAELDGYPICSAEIPGIDLSERPCYYEGAGRLKGSFIRVGDADKTMTDYELYSLEAFRKHLHDDERPIERASMEMMDKDSIADYVRKRRLERPKFARLSDEMAYEMLSLTRDGVPTLAAVMNFGLYPQGFLPQLAVTAIVVPGTDIGDTAEDDARFIDNRRIEGTLSDMLEEALAFCGRNMKSRTIISLETGKHVNRTEYPLAAIREAVLNALIHRDYSHYTEGTPIQIDFFTDRLEIHSPGSLYGRMTVEQLGIARLDQRNPALAVMAETLLGAENRYSGIPTIRKEMAEYGLPEPVFENRRNEFVVILYNNVQTRVREEVTTSQEAADLIIFCKTPRTRQEIADFLGIKASSYLMKRYIYPLLEAGDLKMTLPDRPKSSKQKFYS